MANHTMWKFLRGNFGNRFPNCSKLQSYSDAALVVLSAWISIQNVMNFGKIHYTVYK